MNMRSGDQREQFGWRSLQDFVTSYPLLYAPTTERRRAQRGTKHSGVSSKNIFRSYSSDRLLFISYKFDFFVLKNERGVRGEFHFLKLFILPLLITHHE